MNDKLSVPSETLAFTRGVVWACARLVEMFDQPSIARDILRESGAGHEELKQCAEYDLAFLRVEDSSLPKGRD